MTRRQGRTPLATPIDFDLRTYAQCSGRTAEMYPEPPTRTVTRGGRPFTYASPNDHRYIAAIEAAKAICAGCPVVSSCLVQALDVPADEDRHGGIQGGYTPAERARLRDDPLMVRSVRIAARYERKARLDEHRTTPDVDPRPARSGNEDRHGPRWLHSPHGGRTVGAVGGSRVG